MSKKIRYPNGFVGVVSDRAAETLATRPGHAIVRERPDTPEAEAARQTKNSKEAING